ncbi:MAG: hypothetical protein V7K57_13560 [Nostoc sp.]
MLRRRFATPTGDARASLTLTAVACGGKPSRRAASPQIFGG